MTSTEPVPLAVLVRMAHAVVQTALAANGLRVLHIKGPALAPELVWPGRESTDADVLVPFSQARRSVEVLIDHGWVLETRFENSSAFEHSANLHHETWGYVDLHRTIPGFRLDPDEAFEVLWADRHAHDVAGITCDVPSLAAQVLILLLHAGRSMAGGRGTRDVAYAWAQCDGQRRREVVELAGRLHAELGFDAAFGRLEQHRGEKEYDLWRRLSEGGGSRIGEWLARVRAAPTRRESLRIAARAIVVNVDHLTAVLGRRPRRFEIVLEFFDRPRRGAVEVCRRWVRSRR